MGRKKGRAQQEAALRYMHICNDGDRWIDLDRYIYIYIYIYIHIYIHTYIYMCVFFDRPVRSPFVSWSPTQPSRTSRRLNIYKDRQI